MTRRPVVAVDFDGTLVVHAFPEIGEPVWDAFRVLREFEAKGGIVILWTCRENDSNRNYLDEAVAFCRKWGLVLEGINKTPESAEFRPNGGTKAYADLYLDDRAFGWEIHPDQNGSWHTIEERLNDLIEVAETDL